MARRLDRRLWLAFAALAALAVYVLVPNEPRNIVSLLDGLCESLNDVRDPATLAALNATLDRSAAANFSLRVEELGGGTYGLAETHAWSRELLSPPQRSFSVLDSEVRVEGSVARVQANLLIAERGSSEQHRDLRPAQILLHHAGGRWLIESITIAPLSTERPEARP